MKIVWVPAKPLPTDRKVRPWVPSAAPAVVDYLPWLKKRSLLDPPADPDQLRKRDWTGQLSFFQVSKFLVPGVYQWVVPAGVVFVDAYAIGAGGAGGFHDPSFCGDGGGGGGCGFSKGFPSVPGTVWTITVPGPTAPLATGSDCTIRDHLNRLVCTGQFGVTGTAAADSPGGFGSGSVLAVSRGGFLGGIGSVTNTNLEAGAGGGGAGSDGNGSNGADPVPGMQLSVGGAGGASLVGLPGGKGGDSAALTVSRAQNGFIPGGGGGGEDFSSTGGPGYGASGGALLVPNTTASHFPSFRGRPKDALAVETFQPDPVRRSNAQLWISTVMPPAASPFPSFRRPLPPAGSFDVPYHPGRVSRPAPQLWGGGVGPPPPPVFSVTQNAGRIPRVPESQGRLKPFTEKVSTMLNSLVGGGYIRQGVPATTFSVLGGAVVAARGPTVNDDETVAINPGNIWVNSLTGDVYINVSSVTGMAVWLGPLS